MQEGGFLASGENEGEESTVNSLIETKEREKSFPQRPLLPSLTSSRLLPFIIVAQASRVKNGGLLCTKNGSQKFPRQESYFSCCSEFAKPSPLLPYVICFPYDGSENSKYSSAVVTVLLGVAW